MERKKNGLMGLGRVRISGQVEKFSTHTHTHTHTHTYIYTIHSAFSTFDPVCRPRRVAASPPGGHHPPAAATAAAVCRTRTQVAAAVCVSVVRLRVLSVVLFSGGGGGGVSNSYRYSCVVNAVECCECCCVHTGEHRYILIGLT